VRYHFSRNWPTTAGKSELTSRLRGLYEADQVIIDGLKRQIRVLQFEKAYLTRAMLGDGELRILGKPVLVEMTWPEGRPAGLSDEEILSMYPLPDLP
jgi:hypothetical protein